MGEVYKYNPWLNYALIFHRIREMGQTNELFDLLDERPFTSEEIRKFCTLLFFGNNSTEEEESWKDFVQTIEDIQNNNQQQQQWNPMTNSKTNWIDTQLLLTLYN